MTSTWFRIGASVLLAAGWGAAAALWTPRGPLTNAQALWSIVISAAVGLAAGRVTRSRWAIITTPLAYAAALELTRLPITGPSVDAPHLSAFGLVALLSGRGVHGLLSLLPMAIGAAYGAGPRRRIPIALATAALLAVTVAVAVPARTAAIPGGVAELTSVSGLGVLIRGADTTRPVLLFVPGTPGGSETGAMRRHLAALEQDFVVATLDRRGGGASYPELDPAGRVTVDSTVADILTVTDYLRTRFHQDRIHLLAFSGGSIPGALAAHRAPQKYRAYVGTGQAVDLRASDQLFYTDILAWAKSSGRDDVVTRLSEQGPPPYADFWGYEPFLLHESEAYDQKPPAFEIGVPEYTLLHKAHTLTAIMDTWSVLYPRMQDTDLRRDVPRLVVPAYFIQGGNEMRGLSVLFDEWYAALAAPAKRLEVLPGAGHRAMFEEPDRFAATLRTLLAQV
ncbi:alpha/beta fold hydrolase [Actinoplanes aureus]|uniref:Alpha/beta hydrolase n=1 Tax=Actinoplanes aureus TaxID=2792083 RepID=A0A931G291_9ACTN|nr:alpha/beta hydrolase [Actinoplanes aureus]MBG0567447.1 alpha/beta hydrolase [Actinoplanes aureus]